PPMSLSMEARIAEHAAAPTPPLPVASPPLPLPPPHTRSGRVQQLVLRDSQGLLRRPTLRMRLLRLCWRPYHRHTALALDREMIYARIAWTGSEERSATIKAHIRTLKAHVATLIAHTTSLQTQLTATLGLIETLEARDPEPQDEPAEAGSSC
ncbi:hypothetical protein Tco_0258579, partial [Tanacetum coccineum]